MRRELLLSAIVALMVQEGSALSTISWPNGKADSIVAFTGSRTIFVYKKCAMADVHYKSYASLKPPVLTMFDTDVGKERTLDSGMTDYYWPYISRNGKWATWNAGSATYVIDLLTPGSVKKALISKTEVSYFTVRAFGANQVSQQEYVYALNNVANDAGDAIYKIPFNDVNGTVDLSKATKVSWTGGAKVDNTISVSSDEKKMGGAWPWPDTKILDVASGTFADRHMGGFGCQANLAPDNSYRFAHCNDGHTGMWMFEANLVNTSWDLDLTKGLPGNTRPRDQVENNAPRWSNHVQFISNSYPMTSSSYLDGDPQGGNGRPVWGQDSASFVANIQQDLKTNYCLGKFSADFKSIEKYIPLAMDIRYWNFGGDCWIQGGVTVNPQAPSATSNARQSRAVPALISHGGNFVKIAAPSNSSSVVRVTDAFGRIVCQSAQGPIALNTKRMHAGVYLISAGDAVQRLNVTK